ncbi:NifB/NifX family molybdenum-iron cluster-binding protein [Butyrivibrio sp. AE2032]|uniref:NifB/NifX family molybdenum-iron cluster-binding protein n=1 Tax=Butyrivibrio sp. AE2032 TaxID=1458463 RepID=UPI00054D2595|nr:NifB/NifX family molybdenum-iron cluster-binding protein [Butyrivibrio sp. AE2032]
MPKFTKCRKIAGLPRQFSFCPSETIEGEAIQLTFDEFETIRLLDKEGMTQEQCAREMGVARTTVTAMYESARKKIAEMLVEGRSLTISGGNVRFNILQSENFKNLRVKGENDMRIAVTYDNGEIFQHFGHTEKFKVYDVEDGKIVNEEIVDTNGQGHGALAGFLMGGKVDILICGGIGGGAQAALGEAGIKLYGGVSGSADEAVKAFLDGALDYNPDVKCNHHGEGHTCGNHHDEDHHCGGHCGH